MTQLKLIRNMRMASFDETRDRLARDILPDLPPTSVGEIRLREHQVDALVRIRRAIASHGGALLADEVGMGKTFVALSLARQFEKVHVIAPAALLPMWRQAIRASATSGVQLHSLHRFSQRDIVRVDEHACASTLVVVDEAHHLRTAATLRYSRVADFSAGHSVLLLSATPIHNDARELRSLLALFMGTRADILDAAALETVIVRRNRDNTGIALPDIRDCGVVKVPFDQATLDRIMTLPDPLPARGGATAGALIRLGLLRSWCSSDAALAQAIRVRRLRGEALAHALRNGRYPTRDEIASWIIGDSAVQLSFVEIAMSEGGVTAPLLGRIERHLHALAELQVHHAAHARADEVRSSALKSLLEEQPDRPVVAFSQYTSTVRALYRALRDIAGVGLVASSESRIATGRIPRAELLARFAPNANGMPPPAPHQRVRLLLSTDLLSEGVNLQDAGTVVHLDLPWTNAIRQQRVGRCARLGALFDPIHVYTIEPPPGTDHVLQLVSRLEKKAAIAREIVGDATRDEPSVPELVSGIRQLLSSWRRGDTDVNTTHVAPRIPETVVAYTASKFDGWIAVVQTPVGSRMVAHLDGTTADGSHQVMNALSGVLGPIPIPPQADITSATAVVEQQLIEWIERQETEDVLGPPRGAISGVQAQLVSRIANVVAAQSPARRAELTGAAQIADKVARASRGVGMERALRMWLEQWQPGMNAADWLYGWRAIKALDRLGCAIARFSPIPLDMEWHVSSLLIMRSVAH